MLSYSIRDFKFNQSCAKIFSWFCHFHFKKYFVNSIIFRLNVLCIYWSQLWKIENAANIHISSKVSHSRMLKLSMYKNPFFFLEQLGVMEPLFASGALTSVCEWSLSLPIFETLSNMFCSYSFSTTLTRQCISIIWQPLWFLSQLWGRWRGGHIRQDQW